MNKLLIAFQFLFLVFLAGCTSEAEYVGDLEDGKPHGKGSITYENGDIYDGEWKEGLKEGKGTLTSPDGGKYEGEWKNDKMEGQGTYIWPNGKKYEGEWKDGKKDGEGTILFKDGSKIVKKVNLKLEKLDIIKNTESVGIEVSKSRDE